MNNDITPEGLTVGIGKLKIFTTCDFPHTIPTLAFIVTKDNSNLYTASCMALQIEASNTSEKQARLDLCNLCYDFLKGLFQDPRSKATAWQQLEELFSSDLLASYYKAYRKAQIQLAQKGIELKSRYEQYLETQIDNLKQELNAYKTASSPIRINIVAYDKVA